MADQKISELTAATLPLVGTEEVPLRVASDNRRVAVEKIGARLPGFAVGAYIDQNTGNATSSANISTAAGAANRFDLFAFPVHQDTRIEEIGVSVTTPVASKNCKIVCYESGEDGIPSNLLFETGDISVASGGYAFETRDFTFKRNRLYWLGIRHQANPTLHAHPVATCRTLGRGNNNPVQTAQGTLYRRVLTYANAAPDPYVAAPAELSSAPCQCIIMKVRSLT